MQIIENATKMDIPEAMVETQARQMLDEFCSEICSQQGLTLEQYMQFTGMTADKMMEQMRPSGREENQDTDLFLRQLQKLRILKLQTRRSMKKIS